MTGHARICFLKHSVIPLTPSSDLPLVNNGEKQRSLVFLAHTRRDSGGTGGASGYSGEIMKAIQTHFYETEIRRYFTFISRRF